MYTYQNSLFQHDDLPIRIDLQAFLARFVTADAQRAVVPAQRRAVGGRRNDANLELARQIAEFGVKAGRLTQQLGPGARVADFVGGGARILVGGNVADAFAAGLDRVHLDRRQLGADVGRILQLAPVILDILSRRELAVAAVVFAPDPGQLPKLARIQLAIGKG